MKCQGWGGGACKAHLRQPAHLPHARPPALPALLVRPRACPQEKALLALLQLLQHHGGEVSSAVLEGAGPALEALGARLRAAQAADSEDLYLGDLLSVLAQAAARVAAEQARRQRVEL